MFNPIARLKKVPTRTLLLYITMELLCVLFAQISYQHFRMFTANNICQYYKFDYAVAREGDKIICALYMDQFIYEKKSIQIIKWYTLSPDAK